MKKKICAFWFLLSGLFGFAQSPVFEWARGISSDSLKPAEPASIALDMAGNVYTTGYFGGTVDFDPGPGIYNLSTSSASQVFILKLDPLGNFVWAKSFDGWGSSMGRSITVDGTGNIYTTGSYHGQIDFDPDTSVFYLNYLYGGSSLFICKLDPLGNFVWIKNAAGDSAGVQPASITTDGLGNIYTTGYFSGMADFDPDTTVQNLTAAGESDIFILKLHTDGRLDWVRGMGGPGYDQANSVTVDSSQNVYMTGSFSGTADFNPFGTPCILSSSGGSDSFISKLDSSGDFLWAKGIGDVYFDFGNSIVSDHTGNVYSVGFFVGNVDFDPGPDSTILTSAGCGAPYILKLDSAGNFVWVKSEISSTTFKATSIALDASDYPYITGYFDGTVDSDLDSGVYYLSGASDLFILKLNPSGNFVWARSMGGPGYESGNAIAVDAANNIYTVGDFSGTVDFDPGTGTADVASQPGAITSCFIHKMSEAITTGTGDPVSPERLIIYPNPSPGVCYINTPDLPANYSIEVYNCLGACVYKSLVTEAQTGIDLSGQPNGIYFIKVICDNTVTFQKLIRQ